jgi:hypothetical protein
MNRTPTPLPTFAEFRDILVRDFGCQIEPPPRNLSYGEKRITFLTRIVGDQQYEWVACIDDHDRITGELALNACRHLQIDPENVDLPDS